MARTQDQQGRLKVSHDMVGTDGYLSAKVAIGTEGTFGGFVGDGNPLPIIATSAHSFLVSQAINEIASTYGDVVSVDTKAKSLLKFGRNTAVGTGGATIMDFPSGETDETYVTGNDITHIASTDTNDTQQCVVEGHTVSGSDLTFVVQTVTLQGQTKTALSTPLFRVTRWYNNDSTETAGTIYIAEDVTFSAGVPTPATAIHLTVPAPKQQSRKASTSLSSVDYWLITHVYADILEKTSAYADIDLQVRSFGKVFRQRFTFGAGTGAPGDHSFEPYLIVPPNSDIRLRATASGAGTDVSGGIEGYLAVVVG